MCSALDFDSAWPLLEKAVQMGDGITKEEVIWGLESGAFSFFSRSRSAAITLAEGNTLRIGLAGGDLGELLDIESEIAIYAMSEGFERVEIMGRPGWEKALPGYDRVAVLLRKNL